MANGFDLLPAAEFDAIDANSDGGIDASEWTDFQTVTLRGMLSFKF